MKACHKEEEGGEEEEEEEEARGVGLVAVGNTRDETRETLASRRSNKKTREPPQQ
jgi:hypothetical protein